MDTRCLAAAAGAALLMALPAGGQVTLEQVDRVMEAEADTLDAFRVRLNDPDPNKARAAMRLLISDGDAAQRRLAIGHGFDSTDESMRLEAIRAILDSRPILLFRWVPEGDEVRNTYSGSINTFAGDYEDGYTARVPIEVGAFDEEEDCWTWAGNGTCLARVNAGEFSMNFFGKWSRFQLDQDGRLVGRPDIRGTRVTATADLTR